MKTERQMEKEISIYLDNLILNSKFEDWNNPNKQMIKGNIRINMSNTNYLFTILVYDPNNDSKKIEFEVGNYNYNTETYKWWDLKGKLKREKIYRKYRELKNLFTEKSMSETTKKVYSLLPVKELRKQKLNEILK